MISTILLAAMAATAPASVIVDHGGSDMRMTIDSDRAFIIEYERPRDGLNRVVARGSLLVEGMVEENGRITATAHAFKAGCAPATYPVLGSFDGSGLLELYAREAPTWSPGSKNCQWRLSINSKHRSLVFENVPKTFGLPEQAPEPPVAAVIQPSEPEPQAWETSWVNPETNLTLVEERAILARSGMDRAKAIDLGLFAFEAQRLGRISPPAPQPVAVPASVPAEPSPTPAPVAVEAATTTAAGMEEMTVTRETVTMKRAAGSETTAGAMAVPAPPPAKKGLEIDF